MFSGIRTWLRIITGLRPRGLMRMEAGGSAGTGGNLIEPSMEIRINPMNADLDFE